MLNDKMGDMELKINVLQAKVIVFDRRNGVKN